MFLFKKIVGPLLFPHAIFLALLGIGVLLLWFSSKRRLAKILVTIAACGFLALSYPGTWRGAVVGMESRYPPLDIGRPDLAGIGWVVVLGGGGNFNASLPATSQMSPPSEARLVEGIRIQKSLPDAKLLVSGGSEVPGESDALMMQDAARILGVSPQQIVIENTARDTPQQAEEIKRFVGSDRFILVTSALHMTRAMALFAKQGLAPIPAPADFYIKRRYASFNAETFLPTSSGGPRADALFHEWLGILWEKLRGRI